MRLYEGGGLRKGLERAEVIKCGHPLHDPQSTIHDVRPLIRSHLLYAIYSIYTI